MARLQDQLYSKTNSHKVISLVLPGFPFMSGRLKNKNISKHEGCTIAKMVMKDSRGAQHKVRRITLDGMSEWEAWELPRLNPSDGTYTIITSGKILNTECRQVVGRFWVKEGALKLEGNKKEVHPADGWSIAMAMRYMYIITEKPNYDNLNSDNG